MSTSVLAEKLTGVMVALWFVLIGAVVAHGIWTTDLSSLQTIETGRLLSRIFLLSFVLMIAWVTLVRGMPVAKAPGVQPRISAFLGTNLIFIGVLFLKPRTDLSLTPQLLSTALIAFGNGFAMYSLTYLGSSFSIMAEARQFVSQGPYRLVRHPLYLAEAVAAAGVAIQYASVSVLVLVIMQWAFQVFRILNEEALLRNIFPEYPRYAAQTARLVPGLW